MSGQEHVPWWQKLCQWLWKIAAFLGTAVFLSLGVNLFSTWLTTAPGGIPANAPLSQVMAWWPLLLVVGSCLLLLALLAYIGSRWPGRVLAPSALTRQDRERMLQRLRRTYDEMMNHSLQGAAWLEPGFTSQFDAVQNTATLLLRLTDRAGRQYPTGTPLLQIYDEAAHSLLILGEPGAGKSTLLTALAKDLVTRAEADETHPLPVIFPLSSWATKRLSLENWLIEQLSSLLYDIPRRFSERWVREGLILPLLDGLDELQEDARPACIEAINAYHRERLGALVVCSRTAEYEAAMTHHRLALQEAVVVQPLTREQIHASLARMGKDVAALRSALKKNPALQELATTPLWLNILTLTYRGASVRDLPGKEAALQQQIWTDYVERMVERKGDVVKSKKGAKLQPRYPLEQTCAWLSWLARQMREHKQTVFYLEQLQPDWLPEKWWLSYQWSIVVVIGLVVGLVVRSGELGIGLFVGLFFGLSFRLFERGSEIRPVEAFTWFWKRFVSSRLGVGLFFGLGGEFSKKQLTRHLALSPNERIRRSLKNGLGIGLGVGLLFGLSAALGSRPVYRLNGELAYGLGSGLVDGLLAVVQHYILRFWLARAGVFPWRAVPFLEDATKRVLLQRVGGGYRFTHALLQDYFAELK